MSKAFVIAGISLITALLSGIIQPYTWLNRIFSVILSAFIVALSPSVIAATPNVKEPLLAQVGGIRHTPASEKEGEKLSKQGKSYGDPHIITFDGYKYSFQMVGEFILTKTTSGEFELQARQKAVPNQQLSLNTAVAMKVGNNRIAFYSQDFPDGNTNTPVRVNGKPVDINGSFSVADGVSISAISSNYYVVNTATGNEVTLTLGEFSGFPFINISPLVSSSYPGQFIGLLGNFNGNQDDEMQTRKGKFILGDSESSYGEITQALENFSPLPLPLSQAQSLYFEKLYREFGDSWRITPEESLFDYAPGESTASFTNRSFPSQYLTLNSLLPNQVRQAQEVCQDAGVSVELMEGCIFDVAATGDNSFAQAAADLVVDTIKDRVEDEIRQRLPIPIPRFPF